MKTKAASQEKIERTEHIKINRSLVENKSGYTVGSRSRSMSGSRSASRRGSSAGSRQKGE